MHFLLIRRQRPTYLLKRLACRPPIVCRWRRRKTATRFQPRTSFWRETGLDHRFYIGKFPSHDACSICYYRVWKQNGFIKKGIRFASIPLLRFSLDQAFSQRFSLKTEGKLNSKTRLISETDQGFVDCVFLATTKSLKKACLVSFDPTLHLLLFS